MATTIRTARDREKRGTERRNAGKEIKNDSPRTCAGGGSRERTCASWRYDESSEKTVQRRSVFGVTAERRRLESVFALVIPVM